jgi:dipeptidyl-peptidase-4
MFALPAVLLLIILTSSAIAKKPVTLEVAAAGGSSPVSTIWSPDGERLVWRERGTLRLYELAARKERELLSIRTLEDVAATPPPANAFSWVNRGVREQEVQWFPSGKQLLLRAKGDLFVVETADGKWRQLTKTKVEEGDPKVSPDGRRISYRIDHDLYVHEVENGKITRLTHGGTATLRNGEPDWVYPEELALSTAYWWSPDSRRIAYLQFDLSPEMIYPHGDLTGLRPVAEPQRYPQAGTPNPNVRLGVVAAGGGKTKWLETGAGPESLTARVTWLPDGNTIAVHLLTRVQDRLDLVAVDAGGGKPRTILSETAKTWVNLRDDFQFLSGGRLLLGAEPDGWRHLFLRTDAAGGRGKQLTRGEWEVTALECVDEKGSQAFYTATAAAPTQRRLYRVGFDGGVPVEVTKEAGTHDITMSPGCTHYVDRHSSLTQPERRSLHTSSGDVVAVFAERSSTPEEYELSTPQLLRFRGSDGTLFDARLTRPAGFDPSRKYPAVVMVYGGPHSQTVRDQWRGTDWDQVLANRGFVVWQMDNRGAAGRGHVFESPLYRRFGARELSDQLEGVRHLISMGFVDAQRIGIYGWSYGGFMTLYAMLHSPDTFRAGVSGAPVTDWRNYDTIYTERYLGLPSQNEDGYKNSSPLHFADQLKGRLMLAHNFEDDNVLFQHSLRMMAALQEAGKHFDVLLYPQKAHGVTGKTLRLHMLQGMTDFFERHLKR